MRFNCIHKTLPILLLFNFHICLADSPLTSINFWSSSKDNYVLKIGNKPGKQRLNKQMFNYLMNPYNPTFEKFALINALKWEFNSDLFNSKKFIEYIESDLIRKNKLVEVDLDNINSLNSYLINIGEEYFLLYQYLLAMDNYLDVSEINESISENLQIQNIPLSHFIYSLIKYQEMLINGDFCTIYEQFLLLLNNECITDTQLKNSLRLANSYLSSYSKYCEEININLKGLCNIKNYTVNNFQDLYLISYPSFVFGTLNIYDSENNLILKKRSEGNDLFSIEKGILEKGNYQIIAIEDETLETYEFNLKIL